MKIFKIDEKNTLITVQAQMDRVESLVYKTDIFNGPHEAEIQGIQKQKDGTWCVFYTVYIDYDNDFMDD